ncbi:TIM-barrel domain-containing protein [Shigella flexneri]
MAERDLPLHVFHSLLLDEGLQWCDFEWDPVTFPDPEGVTAAEGERAEGCVWIYPYIGQNCPSSGKN